MTRILYGAAFLHCLTGAYMFGNKYFYNPDFKETFKTTRLQTLFQNQNTTVAYGTKTHKFLNQLDISWFDRSLNDKTVLLLGIAAVIFLFLFLTTLWILVYHVSGMRVLVNSLMHRLGLPASMFELDIQNNPKYFDSLPLSLLEWRIESNIISGDICIKYRRI
jgi:hypothetical protein